MYNTRIRLICLALCVMLIAASAVPVCAQNAVAVSSSAASAILYEPRAGRVLFEQNAHVTRPMASTTKLMTALIAAETLSSDAVLTASAQALDVIGSSMGLHVGDTVTRDDLLKGLLLSSGNDAANVFALTIAPTYEAFAERMNARAQALGMTNTHFVTPSGLDAEGHGSTAYDMALLAAAVLENDTLAAICRMKSAEVTVGERMLTLSNHNKLLSKYPDAIGMKTGYTSLAGRCLVSAAEREGVTLIAVTLDCGNDWEEHMTLFEEGFALMTSVTPLLPSLSPIAVYGGGTASIPLTAETVTLTVPAFDAEAIDTAVSLPAYVWAPIATGEQVGTVTYSLHGDVLARVPVTAAADVSASTALSWFERWLLLFSQLLKAAIT